MTARQVMAATAAMTVGMGGGLWAYFEHRQPPTVVGAAPVEAPELDAGRIAWCAEGLEPLNGGGCFASATFAPRPAPLLIYLHGLFEPSATEDELDRQRRVAQHATARGFAVLALRGRLGLCSGPYATWYCWPSNERIADAGPGMVDEWGPSLRAADKLRGGAGKRYVLGFSNGAFFSGLLAVRALFTAEAFAIAGGGPVEPVHALGSMPPLLLLSADDDPSQEGMLLFDRELTREGWPHDTYSRDGNHALLDPDIEAALTFFLRIRTEKLPLTPPLSTHVPRPHVPDAAAAPEPEPGDPE